MRGKTAPRVLATAALALYWGLVALGSEFSFDPPGPLYDLWYSMAPIVIGAVLAFAVGVYVGQWRILVGPSRLSSCSARFSSRGM